MWRIIMKKAVIPLSGGADSSTCLALATSEGYETYVMFINYGQNNLEREYCASKEIATFYQVSEFKQLDLSWFKQIGGSGLIDNTVLCQE